MPNLINDPELHDDILNYSDKEDEDEEIATDLPDIRTIEISNTPVGRRATEEPESGGCLKEHYYWSPLGTRIRGYLTWPV